MAREAARDDRYLEQRHNHRMILIRRALIFTPMAILFTGLFVFSLMHLWSSIVMAILVGIAALAVDVEAISALRDLRSQPISTRGRVDRLWSKARFLFFGRVHYMLVERKLFEVDAIAAAEVQLGDEVEIHHWPHTHIIITLERIAQASRASSGDRR
jgi:hypothetical protein